MSIDLFAAVVGVAGLIFSCNGQLPFPVGKHRSVRASRHFTFVVLFPLASVVSIIAIGRLTDFGIPSFQTTSHRLEYQMGINLYIGWVLTFIGLRGIGSFKSLKCLSRAMVIIAIPCGPLLMALGIFQIILRLR